tara:strand:- start:772 stop:1989 length:1218 start_codon:yes stop_codon:yes gene_type:complete
MGQPVAILIAVDTGKGALTCTESLQELAELATTAGIEVRACIRQQRELPHPSLYLGSGKVDEVLDQMSGVDIVIADDELRPRQQKALQERLKCKILDRTSLILDIFAQRAQTHEAKIQVELAQLTYLSTRLTRLWTHLSRLGGGVGTRGPGETQLEVDKRLVRARIKTLNGQLAGVRKNRETHRQSRSQRPHVVGAIIGYTNAGKSTVFNKITNSSVMQEDALFATLDPTTRQLILPDSPPVLVTDTVGFIQKLPTLLIDAFYATLESVYEADFFIHVVDVSSPHWLVHIQTTQSVVQANGHPVFYVFNKSDQLDQPPVDMPYTPKRVMSAHSAADIDRLKADLTVFVSQFEHIIVVSVPHTRSDIRNLLYKHGRVIADVTRETHSDITVSIQPTLGEKIKGQLR